MLPAYVIGQTIGWDRDMPFLSALEIHWDDLNAWLDTNEPRISWQFPAPAQAGAPAAPSDTKRKDLSTDDDEIGTRASGEPDLVKGKNGRKRVEAWVEWQAKESVKVGDTTDALAERIRLTADKWGYESERGTLTVASIIKMLPAGITGGRRGRPKK